MKKALEEALQYRLNCLHEWAVADTIMTTGIKFLLGVLLDADVFHLD